MARVDVLRQRKNYSRLEEVLEPPNFLDIQRKSFEWLVNPKEGGIRETIDDVSPIEDYSGNLCVQFGDFKFEEPTHSIEECREKDLTYSRPLSVKVGFIDKDTGEIREQAVFMGDFPWMTDWGTFLINGTERVVVTQLVRSPGAYVMQPKDAEKQVFIATLMPSRGSWLELEIDKKGRVFIRIDRKRKLPVTVLLRSIGYESDKEILKLFDNSIYIRNTIEADTEQTKTQDGALIELFKKQRPGEPPTLDSARSLVNALFFDPKRYDLTRVGRYKLNSRLGLKQDLNTRVLTNKDIVALVKELVSLPKLIGIPEDADADIKDYAAEAQSLSQEPIQDRLDEYEHFGNRRLRTVGELIQEALRVGLYRMERVVRERLTTEDADTITPQTIINIRPVVAALKEFFGSSQLSQFMDQTNTLSGLTHRRRLSALGAGGLTRERAPIEVRDVHPTHYGRMCPIETPEGPNIGLIGSLSSYASVSEHGFVQTPYRVVKDGKVSKKIVWLDATQEEDSVIAQANAEIDPKTHKLKGPQVLCRSHDGVTAAQPKSVELMDVSPTQIWSVATSLIPFLEHDDANRALMGSNMMRQAIPLLKTDAPLVGTGMEKRAAMDSGDLLRAERTGKVTYVDAEKIEIQPSKGSTKNDEYTMLKFMRSNQGTIIHQKPVVTEGQMVKKGDILGDGASTSLGELALGRNLLVAFMSWEGFNFEDAIIISDRLVKDEELTSIHIEEYEVDARATKLGDEEITRDIPNRSEESLRNLDEHGIVRIGAEAASGDILVGKITPKGETELTAEEKLIRAIFKEKARDVRDTSLKVPHGEGGVVIDVKTFSRDDGDDLAPGMNELVRVYVATKRKISEGDKLAGRHGNKGVISKIVPEEDMPFLEDGTSIDVILNPLGVPSRMNLGQILETHLGWVAAHGWYNDGSDAYKEAQNNSGKAYVSCPVFDGATVEDVDEALVKWQQENKDSEVQFDVDKKEPLGNQCSGKVRLYNGRTGEPFDGKVTVGNAYILKLHHLVDDKIHARSTGPYSLVTQQPLGGKAQFGGQRFGEMEVWALEAYGAAYTLQEMLTIKSDDTQGRVKAYESIVKGENIPQPSIPESFKVLLKEMQSLSLSVDVVSEEGKDITIQEEEDDLLRAAEELGIDLSGVRATSGDGKKGAKKGSKQGKDVPQDEREDEIVSGEIAGDVTSDKEGGDKEVGPGSEAGIVDESAGEQLKKYVEVDDGEKKPKAKSKSKASSSKSKSSTGQAKKKSSTKSDTSSKSKKKDEA